MNTNAHQAVTSHTHIIPNTGGGHGAKECTIDHDAPPTRIEYALMIDWDDRDKTTEFVPAKDAHHAEQMARTIYAGTACWTVQREVPEWTYAGGVPILPRRR